MLKPLSQEAQLQVEHTPYRVPQFQSYFSHTTVDMGDPTYPHSHSSTYILSRIAHTMSPNNAAQPWLNYNYITILAFTYIYIYTVYDLVKVTRKSIGFQELYLYT